MTTLDTHHALFETLTATHGLDWPRHALLEIGHSFALAYGELPMSTSFRHDWGMPSFLVLKKVYAMTRYRQDLLVRYPYLAGLAIWGTDVLKPLVTVRCLGCGQPYQTRNPAKWRLHAACRDSEAEEDGTWMNNTEVRDVRNYTGLYELAQLGTHSQGSRK